MSDVKWIGSGLGEDGINLQPGHGLYLAGDDDDFVVLFVGGRKKRQQSVREGASLLFNEYKVREIGGTQ